MRIRTSHIVMNVALAVIAIATLTPALWMVSASFMAPGEASGSPPPLIPRTPTLEHYVALGERLHMGRYFLNSLIIASVVTLVSLFINSMAGFAFAKYAFRGRERLFRVLLSAMVIPAQVTMLPLFLMLKTMGFVNTYAGAVIPGLASIFGIFLIRQFVRSIPDS
ncbi:MAG: carbohydrate ABC transporter permease, partial [Bacteroidetes bacterium]|nr:carbohydrate ABC transporter permease [Bacteroidota bacterium]